MNTVPISGFEEIRHTADWALRVWAPDLATLFTQAARGMYYLEGVETAPDPQVDRQITLRGEDFESLLVAFLNELLYLQETERLAFEILHCNIHDHVLDVLVLGKPIRHLNKAIKAVTFHNLAIRSTPQGLETILTFDV
ncbi:archease [Thermanaerothrix sp. 4228-RoL]|jgi:SHS2 domain-containing protein|uniref:Archease n=1 Tax=Thermanaerothrix solaris TaxID=3058434 RepID=A0ABU3NLR2_9CHLR|nr:archease [Thermanaerothrix sp. 4228-RoL]MDT8897747.1 archease [Thermanaerothrix sp. 4228-RoL]